MENKKLINEFKNLTLDEYNKLTDDQIRKYREAFDNDSVFYNWVGSFELEKNRVGMEFTETEKRLLQIMFRNMYDLVKFLDPYAIDHKDVFNLAQKLGIYF